MDVYIKNGAVFVARMHYACECPKFRFSTCWVAQLTSVGVLAGGGRKNLSLLQTLLASYSTGPAFVAVRLERSDGLLQCIVLCSHVGRTVV